MKDLVQGSHGSTVSVSRETLGEARNLYRKRSDLFESYLNELLWWNEKINLVSRDVSRETLREHIIHSLLVAAMGLLDGIDSWVDAGTGGGLPGIPLAIEEQKKLWLLNDIISKKIAAVKQIVHKLNLVNAIGSAGSIGDLDLDPGTGIITKHAFSVKDLISYAGLKPWRRIIMMKGASEAVDEVKDIDPEFRYVIYRFDFSTDELFYEGKGVLMIEKAENS